MARILLGMFCGIVLHLLAPHATAQAQGPWDRNKGPLILAHRGGAHELEENTLSAFRTSYERGIRGFETDVRMTKDGVFVILHDDTLDRTHTAAGSVEHKTAAELRNVTTKNGEALLFLDTFLDYFADKPGVYLELEMKTNNKTLYPDGRIEEYVRALHQAADARKPADSVYAFTSFDERSLKAMRSLDAHAPTSLIVGKPLSPELIQQARTLKANHIACQLNGTSRSLVRDAQKQGFKVNCWPGHTVQDYHLAIGLGLDIHCTDIPLAIHKVQQKVH